MRIPQFLSLGISLLILAAMAGPIAAQTSSVGFKPSVTPITNEISYYKNIDDFGRSRGTTLQIISINEFKFLTNFIFEFTLDRNWDMDFYEYHDYYLELSIVKPVYRNLSVNYQRIYGTFVDEPINQFGVRISLFSGS